MSAIARDDGSNYITGMTTLNILIALGLIAVVGVLFTGIIGMIRGDEFNRKYGNTLMRARVTLQFVTLGLIFLGFAFSE